MLSNPHCGEVDELADRDAPNLSRPERHRPLRPVVSGVRLAHDGEVARVVVDMGVLHLSTHTIDHHRRPVHDPRRVCAERAGLGEMERRVVVVPDTEQHDISVGVVEAGER